MEPKHWLECLSQHIPAQSLKNFGYDIFHSSSDQGAVPYARGGL